MKLAYMFCTYCMSSMMFSNQRKAKQKNGNYMQKSLWWDSNVHPNPNPGVIRLWPIPVSDFLHDLRTRWGIVPVSENSAENHLESQSHLGGIKQDVWRACRAVTSILFQQHISLHLSWYALSQNPAGTLATHKAADTHIGALPVCKLDHQSDHRVAFLKSGSSCVQKERVSHIITLITE